jgi:ribosomal protein L24
LLDRHSGKVREITNEREKTVIVQGGNSRDKHVPVSGVGKRSEELDGTAPSNHENIDAKQCIF